MFIEPFAPAVDSLRDIAISECEKNGVSPFEITTVRDKLGFEVYAERWRRLAMEILHTKYLIQLAMKV